MVFVSTFKTVQTQRAKFYTVTRRKRSVWAEVLVEVLPLDPFNRILNRWDTPWAFFFVVIIYIYLRWWQIFWYTEEKETAYKGGAWYVSELPQHRLFNNDVIWLRFLFQSGWRQWIPIPVLMAALDSSSSLDGSLKSYSIPNGSLGFQFKSQWRPWIPILVQMAALDSYSSSDGTLGLLFQSGWRPWIPIPVRMGALDSY